MNIKKKYFSNLSKNTYLIGLSSLFADISTEMLYPIIPVFLTQILHVNGSIVGLVAGVTEATQNIAQGFSGWLSDKLRKRKAVALIGYLLSAVAKPLIGISNYWQDVLVSRFIDRLGSGIRSSPRDALLASSVAKEHRGKAFGLEGFGDHLGACLGPLLAFFLLNTLHLKIRYIFYFALIPGLLAFWMVAMVKEKSLAVFAKSRLDMNLLRFPKIYWKYIFVISLFGIGNSSNAFLILQTQKIGVSFNMTLLIYGGFNLVAALISYPAGFISDHLGRKNILLASFVIFFVTYLGFAMTQNIKLIALLFIFYGLYQGIFRSVGKVFVIDFLPEQLRASGIGWYGTIIGLMQLIASIIAGLLWDHINPESVFFYGAFFAFVGIIALMCFKASSSLGELR